MGMEISFGSAESPCPDIASGPYGGFVRRGHTDSYVDPSHRRADAHRDGYPGPHPDSDGHFSPSWSDGNGASRPYP